MERWMRTKLCLKSMERDQVKKNNGKATSIDKKQEWKVRNNGTIFHRPVKKNDSTGKTTSTRYRWWWWSLPLLSATNRKQQAKCWKINKAFVKQYSEVHLTNKHRIVRVFFSRHPCNEREHAKKKNIETEKGRRYKLSLSAKIFVIRHKQTRRTDTESLCGTWHRICKRDNSQWGR